MKEEAVHIVGRHLMLAMVILHSLGHVDNVAKFLLSMLVLTGQFLFFLSWTRVDMSNHNFKDLIQIV